MESAIYIVATPIGNLSDISSRAIEVLSAVDFIAAEDTRHTKRLLSHIGVAKELVALHDHNEKERSDSLIDRVDAGESMALVSDAGTPLISDPGYVLVAKARERGVKVCPIPGACALIAALSASGLPSDRFVFEGFLPAKSKSRGDEIQSLAEQTATAIYYESTHRIVATLEAFDEILPDRKIVLARELTKTFETFLSGRPKELLEHLRIDENQKRGEFVLMVEGAELTEADQTITAEVKRLLLSLGEELPPKKAATIVAQHFGLNKKTLYETLIHHKD